MARQRAFTAPQIGIRELRRRQARLRGTIASQLRELRLESGATQAALAAAAGIDQGHVSRIERGVVASSLDGLVALAAALGADVSLRLYPTASPRLRDSIQSLMIEALIRRLHPRWSADVEVPMPAARGVIDLVIRLRTGELSIACEAHSQIRSIDLTLRRLQEKTLALDASQPSPASSLLLIRSTSATRDLVRLHAATFGAAFPSSHPTALRALTGPDVRWPGPTILWVRVDANRAEVLDTPPRRISVGRYVEGGGGRQRGRP